MKQGKAFPLHLGEAPDPEQLVKSFSISYVKTEPGQANWKIQHLADKQDKFSLTLQVL